jgi:hypothetical protein
MLKGLGQNTILRRCQDLSLEDAYGLFFMVLGAMTETDAWPTFYLIINECLPTWEERAQRTFICPEDCEFFRGEDGCARPTIDEKAIYEKEGNYPICPFYFKALLKEE